MPIRKTKQGTFQAEFQNKATGIKRKRANFATRAEAKGWLNSIRQQALLKRIMGNEDTSTIATVRAMKEISASMTTTEWYAAEWSRLKDRERLAVLFVRYGGRCVYCQQRVEIGERRSNGATKDHVIPIIAGGSSALENLVLACNRCNTRKKDKRLSDCLGVAGGPGMVHAHHDET